MGDGRVALGKASDVHSTSRTSAQHELARVAETSDGTKQGHACAATANAVKARRVA